MSLVLAIESDPRQQAALTRIVRERVHADLIVVDSKDAAIRSIDDRLPDLILLTALFSPRDEEDLVSHLRTLKGAEHLQTLTIPLLATGRYDDDDKPKRGLFGKRKSDAIDTPGCAPGVFAEQIAGYLKTASELKAAAEAQALYAARNASREPAVTPAAAAYTPPVDTSTASVAAPPSPSATFDAPAEAPREPILASAPPAAETPVQEQADPVQTAPVADVEDAFTWRPAKRRHATPPPQPEPPSPPAAPVETRQRPPLLGFNTPKLGEMLEREQAALSGAPEAERTIERSAPVDPVPVKAAAAGVPAVEPPVLVRPAAPPVPQTAPPRIEAPPVKAPQVKAPEVKAPEVKAPEVRAPEIRAPQVRTPEVKAPQVKVPDVKAPEVKVPEVKAPPAAPPRVDPPRVAPPPAKPPARQPVIPQRPGPLVARLPPLAMWARMPSERQEAGESEQGLHAPATSEGAGAIDTNALLGTLRVPAPIATISYPRGCHIRRVTAAPAQANP